jgi:hypothetical protein
VVWTVSWSWIHILLQTIDRWYQLTIDTPNSVQHRAQKHCNDLSQNLPMVFLICSLKCDKTWIWSPLIYLRTAVYRAQPPADLPCYDQLRFNSFIHAAMTTLHDQMSCLRVRITSKFCCPAPYEMVSKQISFLWQDHIVFANLKDLHKLMGCHTWI